MNLSGCYHYISMILQIAPLTDQISVLGGIVVQIADVACQKKCPAMVKEGLIRFQKLIGELASVYQRLYSRCLENSYNVASVSRPLTTLRRNYTVNRLPKIQTEVEFSELMSEHFVGFPLSGGTRNYAHGGKGPFRTSN